MAVAFITEDHNYALAILCLLLDIVIIIATYFRLNYGITINKKRVVAIEQAGIRILQYDDVSNIVVKFTDENKAVKKLREIKSCVLKSEA